VLKNLEASVMETTKEILEKMENSEENLRLCLKI
jgi:hypothetical protein